MPARLEAIKPGATVIYHVGVLAQDLSIPGVYEAKYTAWQLYEGGRVHLIQRLIGEVEGRRIYEYIAVAKMPRLHEQPGLGPRSFHSGMAKLR